ncbi:MAG TPA: hypothetical protein VKA83_09435 [Methylomirabilota bacterium]|nr:hypothetical protein [Methylomirabilota bacterium]
MLADYRELLDAKLKDAASKLTPAEKDLSIRRAVEQYSLVKPRVRVQTITGNGVLVTHDLATDFEEGFSSVLQIEYPVGRQVPEYLDAEQFTLYRDPLTGALKLRLLDITLPNTVTAYVSYTARHSLAEGSGTPADTVPTPDRDPICHLAAAMGFEALAAYYTQETDPSLQADVSRGTERAAGYRELARDHRKLYASILGLAGDAIVGAASAIGDLDEDLQAWGGPRFFHDSRDR